MKRLFWLMIVPFLTASMVLSQESKPYTILLTGASFASPNNKWFEMGCRAIHATAINRAVPGENIAHTANKMIDGTLYSPDEFDNMDVFVIMHVHEQDVYNETNLKEHYQDYPTPLTRDDYAVCYDYVIKRYISDCYNQKFNPKSKYYNTAFGKPASIVLCTNWQDNRTTFNSSVRKLAEKWGFPVVEFDKYIGFSRHQKHPVTGTEFSKIFTADQQEVHGKVYGWHPPTGEDSYIQQRMAAIFADLMNRILLPKVYIHATP